MPGFEIHLLGGLIAAVLLQNHPLAALAVIIGSVFPDLDSKKSIPRKLAILLLGIFSMILLYPQGLLVSIITTLVIVAVFIFLLPKHRKWMHGIRGQLLFSALCLFTTFDLLVVFGGIVGTTIHRVLDGV